MQWVCEIVRCVSCVVSPGRAERGNCLLYFCLFLRWEVALRWNQHFKALCLLTLIYKACLCWCCACWLTGHFWLFQSWATVKPSPLREKLQPDCTSLFTISQTCRTQGKTSEDWQYGGWISLKWWSSLMASAVPLPSPEPSNKKGHIRILRWRMGVRRATQWVEGNQNPHMKKREGKQRTAWN